MKFLKSDSVKFFAKLVISTALLALIFRFIGAGKVYNELLNANLPYIFISIFLVIFLIFFKAIRWSTIVQIFNKRINLASSINYTLISYAFGLVTPGRLGEFIKAKYLVGKTGINYLKSIITIIFDKISDVVIVVLFVLIGLTFLLEDILSRNYLIFALAMYAVILVLSFFWLDRFVKLISNFLPNKYRTGFKKLNINKNLYLKSMLFSVFIWIALSVQAFFVIKALNVPEASFYVVVVIVPLMAISSMAPISIGGIGVREVVAIYSLSLIGIPVEKSTVFSLIYTFVTFGIPAIIGAVVFALKKKEFSVKSGRLS